MVKVTDSITEKEMSNRDSEIRVLYPSPKVLRDLQLRPELVEGGAALGARFLWLEN